MRCTQIGEVVDGAINKRIEFDGEVLVQSDSDGKIIVNNFLQQEAVIEINPSKEYWNNINQIIQPKLSLPDYIQEEISSSTIPGSTRVAESLQVLEDSPLKTLLSSEVEQLKAEVKSLQQEINLYQELIEERLKQPQNTSLTRVGRFDEIFYVGFPQAIERKEILIVHLAAFDVR